VHTSGIFIKGLEGVELKIDEATPLQQLGILNSLRTAILMNYMRDELNISVPVGKLSARSFESVAAIVTLIEDTWPSQ
jgi:acyl carrier protein